MKTAEDRLDIITAFQETGSYRAAAALCGTTHKTVKAHAGAVADRAGSGGAAAAGGPQHRRVP